MENEEKTPHPRDLIEQAARVVDLENKDGRVFESEVETSKAISLKRIADQMGALTEALLKINDKSDFERTFGSKFK